MSAVRSALALQRLYERYRTATQLKTSNRKPGEWLVIEPDSEDARSFRAAFGVDADSEKAEETVRGLDSLNGALRVAHAMDVRMVAQRGATRGRKLDVRFILVQAGKSTRGSKPTPRTELPATIGQLNLDQALQKVDTQPQVMRVDLLAGEKVDTQSAYIISGGTPHGTDLGGDDSDVLMVLPDGTPVPDLSGMLLNHELAELWEQGNLNDLDAMDALFGGYDHLLADVLAEEEEVDLTEMVDRFRAQAVLASGTPKIEGPEAHPGDTWENVSREVVSWTKGQVKALRDAKATGHMIVLAPSPGTGKSRGMMMAADQEQEARRNVGYAVLSRAQIPEAAERLRSNPQVRLIVIEGRHEKNCHNFEQVTVATDAGYAPGSTVCPGCEFYPTFGAQRRQDICPYYRARLDAVDDRRKSHPSRGYLRQTPAIILTTHASAIQGSHIASRRNQSFWNFDTLFLDEDPTSSMVTEHEISAESLTYSQLDGYGNLDGPSRGTMLLREAMQEALRQRERAAERGFVDANGDQDRIHSREYGSSYAGSALHALLESTAHAQNLNLRAIGSMTIDGMTEGPMKGEIMSLNAQEVAARYPNRYLAPLFATLEEETVAIAQARAAGTDLEPAYRVHLDIVPDGDDGHRAVFRVHELRGYANPKTNIIIGDAYADISHYEGLFDRHQRNGKVQAIKHRALWPTTSSLIRVVARAGTKQIRNATQLNAHLETHVRPILELERGRRIVFYVHLAMKSDLADWLDSVQDELEIGEYAIEHWGSGRGKDTYRDFDTFLAVTEYVPNMGALVHEANTVAALASVANTRVSHWNGYAPRSGAKKFVTGLSDASPYFQAAFHRKATDELAQAVHRIRPAMPSPSGSQKRAYVIGHLVPWTDELVAATAATAVVDSGNQEPDLETEALGRGARFSITEVLGLVTEREVAGAINEVFHGLGCWSHIFAHSLMSVPSWATIEDLVASGRPAGIDRHTILKILSEDLFPIARRSPILDRVLSPPNAWMVPAQRLRDSSRTYRAGLAHFLRERSIPAETMCPEWAPPRSGGFQFWGDRGRFEQILNNYAPMAQKVPF